MSYINEALRKAQKERDRNYGQFRGIIAPCSEAAGPSRKRRLAVIAAAALIVLIPAGVLVAVYVSEQTVSMPREAAATVPAEAPVMPQPAALPEDRGKVAKPDPAKPTTPTATARTEASSERRAGQEGSIPENKPMASTRAVEKAVSSGKVAPTSGRPDLPGDARESYQQALYAQRNLDMKRAEILYRRTIELDPGHVRALNNLGVMLMERKKWKEAGALFNKAIVRKKDYVDPYYNLSCMYARRNKIDDSLYYLKAAAALDGSVMGWAKNDADMKNVVASRDFKKMMEEYKE